MFSTSLSASKHVLSGRLLSRPAAALNACTNSSRPTPFRSLSYPSRQRRSSSSSSSKPSNPSDGARGIAQPQRSHGDAAGTVQLEGEKRSAARLRRRKAKTVLPQGSGEGAHEASLNLPAVPSTQYLHPADVAISAFFSLHRPISVTSSVPTAANGRSFEGIFNSSPTPAKASEVISTLSSAVESLEGVQRQQHARSYEDASDSEFRTAITSVSISGAENADGTKHLDGQPDAASLESSGPLLSGKYRPFKPPPVPLAQSDIEDGSAFTTSEPLSPTMKKTYTTVLTILESTHPNGSKTYSARTSPMVSEDLNANTASSPSQLPFLERMRARQEQWDDYRRSKGLGLWAISVKRQRRLKMKKHKYKKLMRKTRNLRRRLERN